jgi:hypothetical protein
MAQATLSPEPRYPEPAPETTDVPTRYIPWIPVMLAVTLVIAVFTIFAGFAP